MSKRGAKVERNSVSDQPHEISYEAHKLGTDAGKIRDTKNSTGNQRKRIEKKIKH